jgi:hypothetical protein
MQFVTDYPETLLARLEALRQRRRPGCAMARQWGLRLWTAACLSVRRRSLGDAVDALDPPLGDQPLHGTGDFAGACGCVFDEAAQVSEGVHARQDTSLRASRGADRAKQFTLTACGTPIDRFIAQHFSGRRPAVRNRPHCDATGLDVFMSSLCHEAGVTATIQRLRAGADRRSGRRKSMR